ncbi:MAG: lipocalin family protein [Flavobacteriales bacterium]|nr:lipocalin family protein [Flavobacteriales bacterium]
MFKSTITKIGFLFIVAISFTACDKYEEGANYSLLTAKMRLVNHWKLEKVTITNGNTTYDATGSYPSTVMKMKKDNTYEIVYTAGNFTTNETGTWEFNDDKTQVIVTETGGSPNNYTIIKLKNKELKVDYVDGSTTYTYEYAEDE